VNNANFSSENINYDYNIPLYFLFSVTNGANFTLLNSVINGIYGGNISSTCVFNFLKSSVIFFEKVKLTNFKLINTTECSVIKCKDVQNFTAKGSNFTNITFISYLKYFYKHLLN
jgi:hypothetical protein